MSLLKAYPSNLFKSLIFSSTLLFNAQSAYANDYPSQAINIIVPFQAGGGVDTMARILAEKLRETLKQNIIVQNKPGASGMLGAQQVVKAKPDGYTLLLGSAGETAINPYIYKSQMRYNPETDLLPVSLVVRVPNVLVVGPALDVGSVAQLVERAKQNPGRLTYGTSGVGNPQHLNGELLQTMSSTKMIHVPYKGAAAQLADVAGGSIDMTFVSYAGAAPFIQSNRVKALAVTSKDRLPLAQDIPSISETAGLESYALENWFGLFAPAGTPTETLEKIHQATANALQDADLAQRLRDLGNEPSSMSPSEFAAFVAEEKQQYKKIVEDADIKME